MSSSSTAGPGGSTTERLQGSLRHSAIARLLVEGRLSSSPAAKDKVSDRRRQVEVHSSPPPPIDLSTNRTSAKQTNANESAAAAAVAGASVRLMLMRMGTVRGGPFGADVDGWVDWLVVIWMDEYMDEWMGGLMDEWMDE